MRVKDINNTSETIKVKVSVCSVKKSISVISLSVRKSRSEDVNKAKFGSFCAALLLLLFSLYFCPVLQCNNMAYFVRSFALIWKNGVVVE